MEIEMDRQLFVLGHDIWKSVDRDSIDATHIALFDANLAKPPFDFFDLKITGAFGDLQKYHRADPHDKFKDDHTVTEYFRYQTRIPEDGINFEFKYQYKKDGIFYSPSDIVMHAKRHGYSEKDARDLADTANALADCYISALIVLLATKNTEKNTEEVKRHGPKSKKRPRDYRYITTINIGKITETMTSDGNRGPVRPHLRRGHIRNQRIGEGRKDVKQIFIQPVFVNADDGWIENQRKEYRVKL
jgi:hypothetical protein